MVRIDLQGVQSYISDISIGIPNGGRTTGRVTPLKPTSRSITLFCIRMNNSKLFLRLAAYAWFSSGSIGLSATIFDSFTPPNSNGGFSSQNGGAAIKISVTQDVTLNGIAILNEMLSGGGLRFTILDESTKQFLYLSAPRSFLADVAGATWKQSDPFEFNLYGGNNYLIGYVRNVDVNDVGDTASESSSGITSELSLHCLRGFDDPTYSHECITGIDFGVRLIAIPEPSFIYLWMMTGSLVAIQRTRRRRLQNNPRLEQPAISSSNS